MSMGCEIASFLAERLVQVRNYSSENIMEHFSRLDLLSKLPTSFLDSLDDKDRIMSFRVTLLCYYVTNGIQGPREMQLRAVDPREQVAAGTNFWRCIRFWN
jgi:hypothetical protein